jgi:hypothetical protein
MLDSVLHIGTLLVYLVPVADHVSLVMATCCAVAWMFTELVVQLSNTNGVKQQLWGLQLSCRAPPGAVITAAPAADSSSSSSSSSSSGGEVLGKLTSYANLEKSGHFGLGYIRCRKGGVQVGSELPAAVVEINNNMVCYFVIKEGRCRKGGV